MRRRISQKEAHRLQKQVDFLLKERKKMFSSWVNDWPGVHIGRLHQVLPETLATVKTARRLGHAVVVLDVSNELDFYASKETISFP